MSEHNFTPDEDELSVDELESAAGGNPETTNGSCPTTNTNCVVSCGLQPVIVE